MKKALILLMSLITAIGLAACGGETTQEKEVGSVETGDKSNEAEVDGEDESEETESYDEVLLDSDNAKVVLESISHVKDEMFDEEYHVVKLAIENKLDKTIVIQADEVSIDGLMVTDNVFFSEEVAGGKKANGKLEIQTFDEELPPLDENLEFKLLVIDEESYETMEDEKVNIDIK